ncbi:MAG: hypothetical protein IT457_05645 [Planctomycetes bacterium]|nr:hypothetical protein [Planctomycetota bacterium]
MNRTDLLSHDTRLLLAALRAHRLDHPAMPAGERAMHLTDLSDPNGDKRRAAAFALVGDDDPGTRQALLEVALDPGTSPADRALALAITLQTARPVDLERIDRAILLDPDPDLRAELLTSRAARRDSALVDVCEDVLDCDPDELVRDKALDALEDLADESCPEALLPLSPWSLERLAHRYVAATPGKVWGLPEALRAVVLDDPEDLALDRRLWEDCIEEWASAMLASPAYLGGADEGRTDEATIRASLLVPSKFRSGDYRRPQMLELVPIEGPRLTGTQVQARLEIRVPKPGPNADDETRKVARCLESSLPGFDGGLVWLRARSPGRRLSGVLTYGRIERDDSGRFVANCCTERSPASEPGLDLVVPIADLEATIQHPRWGIAPSEPS